MYYSDVATELVDIVGNVHAALVHAPSTNGGGDARLGGMCADVGDDAVILMAAEASELELNMAEPIIEGVAATVGDIDMHAGCEGGLRG